jgi:fructose-1,6-bisphosphatase/inositol monophosphatase family enzyme
MTHPLDDAVTALMREVAATIIMPRFQMLAAHEISEKTPGDLVTVADHESEARLSERLAGLLPEARVIGEEAVAADGRLLNDIGKGVVWIIDPLDGTMNFTEGKRPFAIMIGLVADAEPQAGWILDPVSNRICHAARGQGAFVDGERIHARPSGNPLPLGAIAPYFLPADRKAAIERRAAGKIEIVAIPRCAGEQYPRLALGQNDIALFEKDNPWDHVPGALILEEAGGRLARPDGTPYRVDRPGKGLIGAATPPLWDQAAHILVGQRQHEI